MARMGINNDNHIPEGVCRKLYNNLMNASEVFYSSKDEMGICLNMSAFSGDYMQFDFCPFCGREIKYTEVRTAGQISWREESDAEYAERCSITAINNQEMQPETGLEYGN